MKKKNHCEPKMKCQIVLQNNLIHSPLHWPGPGPGTAVFGGWTEAVRDCEAAVSVVPGPEHSPDPTVMHS